MKKNKTTIVLICFLLIATQNLFTLVYAQHVWNYPLIQPDTTIDYYFGKKIIDPFSNLENMENQDIKDWFNKQRAFSDSILANISNMDLLEKEVNMLWDSSPIYASFPRSVGSRTFFSRVYYTEGFEKILYYDSTSFNYIDLFSTDSLNKKHDTYYSIDYYEPSFDGKYLVFGLSQYSYENTVMHVMDVEKKQLLPEEIPRVKGGNPQWLPDNSGFFYQQFKEILSEEDKKAPHENSCVKLHHIYTNPLHDVEMFSQAVSIDLDIQNIDFPLIFTYPSSKYILAAVNHGSGYYSKLFYAPLKDILEKQPKSIKWNKICDHENKATRYSLYKDTLFVLSFSKNPNGLLEKITLPDISKTDILFEGNDKVAQEMVQTKNALYLSISENGISKILQIDLNSDYKNYLTLPFEGAIKLLPYFEVSSFYQHHENLYFQSSSWNKELRTFIYKKNDDQIERTDIQPSSPIGEPNDLVFSVFEVPSHDGTLVPLTIIHNTNMKRDRQNPTILYAYGAYGYSVDPFFYESRLAWFKRGGIYAIAHVRGGGEKGERWYKGGFKRTKPNSWKDFIACAEYLTNEGYTSPNKLAAIGVSAGGITIGRAITEKPELLKTAAIFDAPLNTLKSEIILNSANIAEYGTVKDSLEFQYLFEMDTYHHIHEEINYPSVLFYAGMKDARVVPWLSGKVAARMQALSNNNIILFKTENVGHNAYTDYAFCYAFLLWQLDHPDFLLKKKGSFYKK